MRCESAAEASATGRLPSQVACSCVPAGRPAMQDHTATMIAEVGTNPLTMAGQGVKNFQRSPCRPSSGARMQ
jgi:hypothetical protein